MGFQRLLCTQRYTAWLKWVTQREEFPLSFFLLKKHTVNFTVWEGKWASVSNSDANQFLVTTYVEDHVEKNSE